MKKFGTRMVDLGNKKIKYIETIESMGFEGWQFCGTAPHSGWGIFQREYHEPGPEDYYPGAGSYSERQLDDDDPVPEDRK